MRRVVLPMLVGLLTVLLAVAPASAARPTDWVHVCATPEDGIAYGHVAGPGMQSEGARYWSEWCEDIGGQSRGVRPYPKRV